MDQHIIQLLYHLICLIQQQPEYQVLVGIWIWVLVIIPHKSGYLGMGFGCHLGIIPNTH